MNDKWKATDLLEKLDKIYTDIDIYFINADRHIEQANNMYKAVSITNTDLPITSKEMIERK